jgi:hypothetical protein
MQAVAKWKWGGREWGGRARTLNKRRSTCSTAGFIPATPNAKAPLLPPAALLRAVLLFGKKKQKTNSRRKWGQGPTPEKGEARGRKSTNKHLDNYRDSRLQLLPPVPVFRCFAGDNAVYVYNSHTEIWFLSAPPKGAWVLVG